MVGLAGLGTLHTRALHEFRHMHAHALTTTGEKSFGNSSFTPSLAAVSPNLAIGLCVWCVACGVWRVACGVGVRCAVWVCGVRCALIVRVIRVRVVIVLADVDGV